jgi:hypothetical protein
MTPPKRHRAPNEALNTYLTELDPLGNSDRSKAFRLALASSSDGRFVQFLDRLGQPGYHRYSLAAVARTCDLSLPEFHELWYRAQIQRALSRAVDAMPEIIEDIAYNAISKDVSCNRCDGLGRIDLERQKRRVCPACKGKGSVRKPGDAHAIDTLIQVAGFGKKGVPPVQITFGEASMESAVDRLNKITFDVSDRGGHAIDGEAESSRLE